MARADTCRTDSEEGREVSVPVRIVGVTPHTLRRDLEVVAFKEDKSDERRSDYAGRLLHTVAPAERYSVGSIAAFFPPGSVNAGRTVKARRIYGEWSDGELEKS